MSKKQSDQNTYFSQKYIYIDWDLKGSLPKRREKKDAKKKERDKEERVIDELSWVLGLTYVMAKWESILLDMGFKYSLITFDF